MTRIGSLTTEIVEAYKRGERMLEIATRLNIGQGSVWRTLDKENITRRPHGFRKPTIKMPAEPGTLGYIAGLFDGDGGIQFKKKHNGRSLGCKIQITNTCKEIHEWLVSTIGGKVIWRTDRVEKYGWAPCGYWTLYRGADVCLFIEAIAPYLIIKREAIAAALDLFSHYGLTSGN